MSCKNAMQDGRAFTDYSPSCTLNELIQRQYGINNSTQYRLFLQRNGWEIENIMRQRAELQHQNECKCDSNRTPLDDENCPRPYDPNNTDVLMRRSNKPYMIPSAGLGRWNQACAAKNQCSK